MANNYTLGRGKLYFARFRPGTRIPLGERYIGNTPEFSLTIENEELEHFSSDGGIREKDDSIALEVTRSGSLTTDNIDPENVALFFFGEKATLVEAGATITGEAVEEVQQGFYYQLGQTVSRPSGARGIAADATATPISVVDAATAATVFDEGDDYTVDLATGRLYIVPGGAIANDTDLVVGYTIRPSTRQRVISGSTPVEGALRYIADNPKGDNLDYYFPYVQIAPNGDYALKAEEWQAIPFSIEVLKLADREAIYLDGRPAFA
jgi:hypothetical protein